MNEKTKKRAICVLGMHRTGTSAIAGTINMLVVYWAETNRLMKSEDDNPKGFWVHIGIVEIHEQILYALSHNWYDIWPIEKDCWKNPEIQIYKDNLVELVKTEFKDRYL